MRYQVIVGNIGTVYDAGDREWAQSNYDDYVALSKSRQGRAADESVVMLENGEVVAEYCPTLRQQFIVEFQITCGYSDPEYLDIQNQLRELVKSAVESVSTDGFDVPVKFVSIRRHVSYPPAQ